MGQEGKRVRDLMNSEDTMVSLESSPAERKSDLHVFMITEALDRESCHLGFVIHWIRNLASQVRRMSVAACFNRDFEPPPNVKIYPAQRASIYAAQGTGTLRRVSQMICLFFCLSRILLGKNKVDIILAHMNPVFVLLAFPIAKLRRIPIILWFARGTVSGRLRLAHHLCDRVITAAEESFKIQSPRRVIIGHGIDTKVFTSNHVAIRETESPLILCVGRVVPIKRCDLIVEAFALLKQYPRFRTSRLVFAGDIIFPIDATYVEKLKERIRELGIEQSVEFKGKVQYEEVPALYQSCDLFVNATNPGSVDKAVLEAMACEKPVVTSNTAFQRILGTYDERLYVPRENPSEFARKMAAILEMSAEERRRLGEGLRQIVMENHSLEGLCSRIVGLMEDLVGSRKTIHG